MLFRSVFAFWRSDSPRSRRPRPSPNQQHGVQLHLEALEDRCVPSTLNVANNADNGATGTLRWAVAQAQTGDTIDIVTTQPIVLTQGELNLNKNVTIEALAGSPATISGNGNSRVFEASAAYVNLNHLNITGGNGVADNPSGNASLNGYGGGILNDGYNLTFNYCTVSGNSATDGGGIYNGTGTYFGTCIVDVMNSTLSGNAAMRSGGGIYNGSGAVDVNGSTLSGNSAAMGGGIYNGGSGFVSGSTVFGNTATQGGGIYNASGQMSLHTTVSGNSAADGGGIYNSGGSVYVYPDTIFSRNSATHQGGGIYNARGSVLLYRFNNVLPYFSGNTPDAIYGSYTIITHHRPVSY